MVFLEGQFSFLFVSNRTIVNVAKSSPTFFTARKRFFYSKPNSLSKIQSFIDTAANVKPEQADFTTDAEGVVFLDASVDVALFDFFLRIFLQSKLKNELKFRLSASQRAHLISQQAHLGIKVSFEEELVTVIKNSP